MVKNNAVVYFDTFSQLHLRPNRSSTCLSDLCNIFSCWIYNPKILITPAAPWPLFTRPGVKTNPKRPECSRLICLKACSRPLCLSLTLSPSLPDFHMQIEALVFHNTSASKKPRPLQTHHPVRSIRGFSKSSSPPGFLFFIPTT